MKNIQELLETDTDLAAFVKFYKRFNINLDNIWLFEENKYVLAMDHESFIGPCTSEVSFDLNGKFITQGFWD